MGDENMVTLICMNFMCTTLLCHMLSFKPIPAKWKLKVLSNCTIIFPYVLSAMNIPTYTISYTIIAV